MTSNEIVAELRKYAKNAKGDKTVHIEGVSKRAFLDTTQAIIGRILIGVINREYICPCCGCKTVVVGMTDIEENEEKE